MSESTKNEKAKNGKSLVIVESPAKAKTINRYLGSNFIVKASMGHIRDLPQRTFGVDIENQFKPTYRILPSRKKIINELKKVCDGANSVYLATDLDREGEAIAWHLAEALKLPESKTHRVIFNEITKRAINQAFQEPKKIDMDKVNAQQARRILDRIVGYQLSPLLWKKIAKNLSAGRVQSVAVRLIVEREEEIEKFTPEEYWRITAVLGTADNLDKALRIYNKYRERYKDKPDLKKLKGIFEKYHLFKAELIKIDGETFKAANEKQASEIRESLSKAEYRVAQLNIKQRKEKPPGPFTTATLQQQASSRLNFTAERTMRIAQQLYEGVELGHEGSVALITYMRTDSTHIAPEAINSVRNYIAEALGKEYLPESPNYYASKAQAQQAHEAIRPTDVNRRPEDVKQYLTREQFRLYDLIWRRFVASQTKPAIWNVTEAIIEAKSDNHIGQFKSLGRILSFAGFLKLLPERLEGADAQLPPMEVQQTLNLVDLSSTQHFTQPPPRFNEASLVRTLEAAGIGRPSTYANIISTIQKRGYVEKKEKRFYPTDLGRVVTKQLIEHFPQIMDVKFTSYMEHQLDKIEEAHLDWVSVLSEFYEPFKNSLERALENMEKQTEVSPYKCELCGRDMLYRWTKSGRFLACSGYPECQNACSVDDEGRPIKKEQPQESEHKCPKCGAVMLLRKSRYGTFLGCSKYPDCKTTIPCDEQGRPLPKVKPDEVGVACPECGKPMIAKRFRGRQFLACSGYPDCKTTLPIPEGLAIDWPEKKVELTDVKCPKCGSPMAVRVSRRGKFLGCSAFPKCRTIMKMPKEDEKKDEEDNKSQSS